MTGESALQLLLPVRHPGLALLVLLAVLFVGAVAAVGAAGDGAEHAVVSGIVTGDAADRGALQAALGVRRRGGNDRERSDGENGGGGFHGATSPGWVVASLTAVKRGSSRASFAGGVTATDAPVETAAAKTLSKKYT